MTKKDIVVKISTPKLTPHPSIVPKFFQRKTSQVTLPAKIKMKKMNQMVLEQLHLSSPSASAFFISRSLISKAHTRIYRAWKAMKPRDKTQAIYM